MKPQNYRDKYLKVLSKKQITHTDVANFKDTVQRYEFRYPNWEEIQQEQTIKQKL